MRVLVYTDSNLLVTGLDEVTVSGFNDYIMVKHDVTVMETLWECAQTDCYSSEHV